MIFYIIHGTRISTRVSYDGRAHNVPVRYQDESISCHKWYILVASLLGHTRIANVALNGAFFCTFSHTRDIHSALHLQFLEKQISTS